MTTKQRPWAIALAVISVLLLAFPSALAVYEWLKPVRGEGAARSAAAGIELTYLALACLIFNTPKLQKNARNLQLWAVLTAVLINSIDSYSKRGVDLSTGARAWSTFDPWLLGLSIVESIPLAGLAFGVSMVLHQLVAHDAMADELNPDKLSKYANRVFRSILDRLRRPEQLAKAPNAGRPIVAPASPVRVVSGSPGTSDSMPSSNGHSPATPLPEEPAVAGFSELMAEYSQSTTSEARRIELKKILGRQYNLYPADFVIYD